ncbi:hypothetical protein ACFOLF_16350 [Paenibacillus sepulcri]
MIKFAGIANPYHVGAYSVERNAAVLQRYRYLHEGLLRAAAGQLPGREDWNLRMCMCKHLYEDAEAADLLRRRIPELRTSSAVLSKEPDPRLTLLMEELVQARTDLEWASAVYEVIKPAMLEAFRFHLDNTQQIVDQPTIRLLRQAAADLEAQLEWAAALLADLRAQAEQEGEEREFCGVLRTMLLAAGGVAGDLPRSADVPRRWRSGTPYAIPGKSRRDPRRMGPTTLVRTGVENPPADPVLNELVIKMRVRQEEMTACDLIAGVLYTQSSMPWSFYYDLARHIWDEARHAMFGQAALEEDGYEWMTRPQYTSDYDINAEKIPAAKYAWLSIGIEEGAMISLGKKKEYEWCRDEAKHPLMTQFQDYDWADEIVHANLGRKWAPDLMGEPLGFVREIAQKELDHFWAEVRKAEQQA